MTQDKEKMCIMGFKHPKDRQHMLKDTEVSKKNIHQSFMQKLNAFSFYTSRLHTDHVMHDDMFCQPAVCIPLFVKLEKDPALPAR